MRIYKCANYYIARGQRKNEIAAGHGTDGTDGYEKKGCYSCIGYNTDCGSHVIIRSINEAHGESGLETAAANHGITLSKEKEVKKM